ncbi:L-type lectin-domain containing protein [Actinoplanes sp. TFC3]|uniref:L-type lectin-domain containing protein n=1 Tax=Actinoplanes sp. TFC3 TaxID=1710355 RepID=UPI00082DE8F4|nr:L-type lectin-domain containing protein [Actinoplanes sp. TFC3]
MSRKIRFTRKAVAATAAVVAVAMGGTTTAAQAAVSVKVIDYPNFDSGPDLSLRGVASLVKPANKPTVLRLVKNKNHTTGAAWAAPKINPTKPFVASFVALSQGGAVHGDGIAFVFQGAGNKALGWDGGGMGYSGIKPSLAVEFDTYKNPYDINANHVAIVTGGNAEVQTVSATAPVNLVGKEYRGTVIYDPATKNLRVFVSAASVAGYGTQVINRTIDLAKAVGTGPVNVGFTSANGTHYGVQDIISWTMVAG